jgi:hypothetical protein
MLPPEVSQVRQCTQPLVGIAAFFNLAGRSWMMTTVMEAEVSELAGRAASMLKKLSVMLW